MMWHPAGTVQGEAGYSSREDYIYGVGSYFYYADGSISGSGVICRNQHIALKIIMRSQSKKSVYYSCTKRQVDDWFSAERCKKLNPLERSYDASCQ